MTRRLIEIAIIQVFETEGSWVGIKDADPDDFQLSDRSSRTLNERTWTLSRNRGGFCPRFEMQGTTRLTAGTIVPVERISRDSALAVESLSKNFSVTLGCYDEVAA
ncbi:MAG: hypothetical protein KatS3mg077_0027 [Candidatus Binatia bacterium]|nr:MAG: hypothetical protein KatS3mg077_0027 [Candidatus Binatia bacterium]